MIIGGFVMKKKRLIAMIISAIMVFSMIPMAVFAAEDSAITTTLPAEAKVGEQVEFGVTSTAGSDANKTVLAKFHVSGPAVADTEYYETGGSAAGQWLPLTGDTFGPTTGFPFLDNMTSKFRTTFHTAGTYTVTIDIVDFNDQTQILASTTQTINVTPVVEPTVTIDMPATFTVGQPMEFSISTTGGDKAGTMVLGTSVFSGSAAIEKIEYYEVNDGNWYELTGDHFGPASGFPLGDFTSKFRVTFKEAGTFSLTVNIVEAANQQNVLATATQSVTSVVGADYTKVDEAIAKANTLNRDEYKDFSGVDSAVNAVVRGKNITQQAEVDAMAQAIEDAIATLEKKEETPVNPAEPTEPTTPGASGTIDGSTEQGMNSPQTGDNNHTVIWIAVAILAAGTMTGTVFFVRKKKAE